MREESRETRADMPFKILVVEDDEGLLRLIQKNLRHSGFQTDGVLTGTEALSRLLKNPYSLAMLDYKLPDMTAKDLIEHLSAKECKIPFIIMTGYGDEKIAVEMMKLGARDYLTKGTGFLDLMPRLVEQTREQLAVENRLIEAERALKKYHEDLEKQVRERTAELTVINQKLSEQIIERKSAEEALRLSCRFLEITNRHSDIDSLLKEFLEEASTVSGCGAIGIRILDEEGNIPYQDYRGFSEQFYESENLLSIRSDQCMCINVIRGSVDPNLSFYTKGGSFYMNGTTRFLATVSEQKKGKTRNVCNEFGYESVALIPMLDGKRIIGLIHLADGRENMVPLEMVQKFETAAKQLGTALARVQLQQKLRDSETRYRRLSETLDDMVKKKVAELQQAQSLAAIGQMVSVVAHDIRNPLHTIQMGISGIRKELSEDKKNSEILEEIDYGINALNSVIGELLEYARPVIIEYAPWPMRALVDRALNTLRDQIAKINVHLELEEEKEDVQLDGAKMIRVLSNLISNAAEAMPAGGDLRIASRFFDHKTGKVLRLSISDNGHGIDEKDLERICEPFVTTKPQGTGLGIPICKKIITAHNGSFRIRSKANEGTIVDIELPVGTS